MADTLNFTKTDFLIMWIIFSLTVGAFVLSLHARKTPRSLTALEKYFYFLQICDAGCLSHQDEAAEIRTQKEYFCVLDSVKDTCSVHRLCTS